MKKRLIVLGLLFSFAVSAGVIYYGPGRAVLLENILQFANFLEIESKDSDSLRIGGEVLADSYSGSNVYKNHIPIGAFERGENDFNSYVDAAGVLPVDGTGGGPSTFVSCSQSSSSPLEGDGSLSIVKFNAASGGQGHGCSYDFNVGTDQARMMEISFDYLWTDVAANADGDFIVYIYDVDNGVLIQPVGYEIFRSGFKSQHKATFQTDAASDDYRVIFHVAQDRADVYSLKVDNLYIGPQRGGVSGAVDVYLGEIPLTTNDTSGNLTISAKGWRKGDLLFVDGAIFFTGSGNVSSLQLATPYSFDFDKTSNTKNDVATWVDNGTAYKNLIPYPYAIPSTGVIRFLETGTINVWDSTQAASGDSISFKFSIPILGWSSNTVMSEDAGNREIAFFTSGLTAQTFSTTAYNYDILTFPAPSSDTSASWDSTNNWYVIPETGYYDISGGYNRTFSSAPSTSHAVTIGIFLNGTTDYKGLQEQKCNGVATNYVMNGAIYGVYLEKGTKISLYARTSSTIASSKVGDTRSNYFSIAKRSSPVTIAASEKVICKVAEDSGALVPASTLGDLIFDTVIKDSHGGYKPSTGEYIIPTSGDYRFTLALKVVATDFLSTGSFWQAYVYYNASSDEIAFVKNPASTNQTEPFLTGSTVIPNLNKGDVIVIKHRENSTDAINLNGSVSSNYFIIEKL